MRRYDGLNRLEQVFAMKKIMKLCVAVGIFSTIPGPTTQAMLLLGGFFLLWSGLIQLFPRIPLTRGAKGGSHVSFLLPGAGCIALRPIVLSCTASVARARIDELNKV